jgi:hypothetical protein
MEIRDLKLKLAKELLDPEIVYRMMQLTASIAMEMASIASFRMKMAAYLPVGNSKPANVEFEESKILDEIITTLGKSNAEQRAATLSITLHGNDNYQSVLEASNTFICQLAEKEALLKGYKMEWQVIQENMMNQRAAAALLEGITDVEVKKKPKRERMPVLTPEQ